MIENSYEEIRERFLSFFEKLDHKILDSVPLTPQNDDSLLFVNSGMVPFKDLFLGVETPRSNRVASCQKCLRAGGKHNDLENVGFTSRHHTFFEMLGNWSFGDYFKEEAIVYAWNFLTKELKLDKDRLLVTVHHTDDESAKLWSKVAGLNDSDIIRLGEDNFWSAGEFGVCGPSTEIFYDYGEGIPGDKPGTKDEDLGRYTEIWNLVFIQYNRLESGKLEPLKFPSVDTGMGLERIASVLQGKNSNFDTSLFTDLIEKIKGKIVPKYSNSKFQEEEEKTALKIIADHSRAISFMIADGIVPSNEGRGYVLRRIIRRAIRYGFKLGITDPFLYNICSSVGDLMGGRYSELISRKTQIYEYVLDEEKSFKKTMSKGILLLEEEIKLIPPQSSIFSGESAFKLYDTFGFPLDVTKDILREKNKTVDIDAFNKMMQKQKRLSKDSSKVKIKDDTMFKQLSQKNSTEFLGYTQNSITSKILYIFDIDGQNIKDEDLHKIDAEKEYSVILNKTVFYAESGGQIADIGIIENENFKFEVSDVQKYGDLSKEVFVHLGKFNIKTDDKILDKTVSVNINKDFRNRVEASHTGTHILLYTLMKELGETVEQKGSFIGDGEIRFDFNHNSALTQKEIYKIEDGVNKFITSDYHVETKTVSSVKEAEKLGALMLANEKYDTDNIRILGFKKFDEENLIATMLCGGTHVKSTGEIGLFKIVSERSISKGIRRIECLFNEKAIEFCRNTIEQENDVRRLLKSTHDNTLDKLKFIIDENKINDREIDDLRFKVMSLEAKEIHLDNHKIVLFNLSQEYVNIVKVQKVMRRFLQEKLDTKEDNIIISICDKTIGVIANRDSSEERFNMIIGKIKEIFQEIKGGGHNNLWIGNYNKKIDLDLIIKSIGDLSHMTISVED
ncbi:MAG: alanine--tRNA ligase [Alphaproteobacteria bacterium]|nr:alanine--tRNA ligase [Alphaproteobacteria bacterium]